MITKLLKPERLFIDLNSFRIIVSIAVKNCYDMILRMRTNNPNTTPIKIISAKIFNLEYLFPAINKS